MTTLHFLEQNILAKCTRDQTCRLGLFVPAHGRNRLLGQTLPGGLMVVLMLFSGANMTAQTCAETARTWRKAATRTALAACVVQNIAPAQLAMAQSALDSNQFEQAAKLARAAGAKLTGVKDVAAWIEASAQFGLKDYEATLAALPPVWATRYPTPLYGKAALLGAKAAKEIGDTAKGIQLLKQHSAELTQPQGDFLFGELQLSAGELTAAATAFQKVYFYYPTSAEAVKSGVKLAIIQATLGAKYPSVGSATWLERIGRLLPGRPGTAREEIMAMSGSWSGQDKELATVRKGAADYFAGAREKAYGYLQALHVVSPSADAERLYYMFAAAKRLNREADMQLALKELTVRHATSKWRLNALTDAGYYYLTENRYAEYEPIYAACAESFQQEPKGAFCHWKLTWSKYLRHRPEATGLLRAHLEKFPQSEKANSALYFLGRDAERQSTPDVARAYYQAAADQFPNTYYAMESRRRLNDANIPRTTANASVADWAAHLAFPDRKSAVMYTISQAAQWSLDRSKTLESAGLAEYSETELRAIIRREGQNVTLATYLAELMQRQGQIDRGIRHIKGSVPSYLYLAMVDTGEKFWRLAFPMPYSQSLIKFSEERSIDPFLMAGLIRQESEFNPVVISHANAYGLTQVMPATGRELAQRLGIPRFTTAMLTRPEINLNMGTYYVRMMLDSLDNNVVETLAAYNAGRSRVIKWRAFGPYREPSEFIETIPFDETRDYVQSVIRNGETYRQLYSKERELLLAKNDPVSTAMPPEQPVAAKPAAAKPAAKKATNAKRKVQKR